MAYKWIPPFTGKRGGLEEARHNFISAHARVVWEREKLDICHPDLANYTYALEELRGATHVLQDMMQRVSEGEIFYD